MRCYDVIGSIQDLTNLDWQERHSSSGTSGMLLKARSGNGASMLYYKLSCFDDYRGIYGHECVNEIIASRLMNILGVEHLAYRLIHARIQIRGKEYETWINSSKNFRKQDEAKQAFDQFYSLNKQGEESPWDFALRMGWKNQIEQMMLVDFLIANRDRHGANIEVLRSPGKKLRLAPLFDNGLSFVFSSYGDEARARTFDPLEDVAANNFIGSRSLQFNIEHFNVRPKVHALKESDKAPLLAGLENAASPAVLEAAWNIVWQRWQWYADFCNH